MSSIGDGRNGSRSEGNATNALDMGDLRRAGTRRNKLAILFDCVNSYKWFIDSGAPAL